MGFFWSHNKCFFQLVKVKWFRIKINSILTGVQLFRPWPESPVIQNIKLSCCSSENACISSKSYVYILFTAWIMLHIYFRHRRASLWDLRSVWNSSIFRVSIVKWLCQINKLFIVSAFFFFVLRYLIHFR